MQKSAEHCSVLLEERVISSESACAVQFTAMQYITIIQQNEEHHAQRCMSVR